MMPESLRGFVLCTNMSGNLFSSSGQTSRASSSSSSSSSLGWRYCGIAFWRLRVNKRAGGTKIDLALINYCTMIHDFCQTAGMIYSQHQVSTIEFNLISQMPNTTKPILK